MAIDFHELSDRLQRFSSPNLALRPLCLADAWPLFQASRHPQFNEHLAWDQPADIDGAVARVELICKAARRGELSALAAVARDTGEWVSLFRFFPPMDAAPGVLEMGIWTHQRFWTGRHSLELGRLCVDTAFRVSSVRRLIGLAAPGNRGSMHLMRLVGMTERCRSFKYHETGRKLPTVQYEISRGEWEARRLDNSPFHEFCLPASAFGDASSGLPAALADVSQSVEASVALLKPLPRSSESLSDLLMREWASDASTDGPLAADGVSVEAKSINHWSR